MLINHGQQVLACVRIMSILLIPRSHHDYFYLGAYTHARTWQDYVIAGEIERSENKKNVSTKYRNITKELLIYALVPRNMRKLSQSSYNGKRGQHVRITTQQNKFSISICRVILMMKQRTSNRVENSLQMFI